MTSREQDTHSSESENPLSYPLWPKSLKTGDLVVLVSPSDGIDSEDNQNWSCTTWKDINNGVRVLESWGLRVECKLNGCLEGFTAGTAEQRRKNLRSAICRNPGAIWVAKGGYAAGDVIPVLEESWVRSCLRQNRPVFIGYSDSTLLEGEIFQKTGLISWCGIHAGGLENTWDEETIELNRRAVFGERAGIHPGDGVRVIQKGGGDVTEAMLLPVNLETGSRVNWNLPGVRKVIAVEDNYDFWDDARRAWTVLWNNLGGHKGEIAGIILGTFSDMRHDGESYPDWSRNMTAEKLVREVIGNRPELLIVEFKHFGHPVEGKRVRLHPLAVGANVRMAAGE
jgi:muramoyltetrapeptide carboxypeptidase LdcA involved in peptidoglycan recycling